MDKANGNYRLIPTSPYNSGSTDGLPLGADFGTLMQNQPRPPGTVAPPPPPPPATARCLWRRRSPASVTAGTAAFNLTVNGSSFVPSSIVRWKARIDDDVLECDAASSVDFGGRHRKHGNRERDGLHAVAWWRHVSAS